MGVKNAAVQHFNICCDKLERCGMQPQQEQQLFSDGSSSKQFDWSVNISLLHEVHTQDLVHRTQIYVLLLLLLFMSSEPNSIIIIKYERIP